MLDVTVPAELKAEGETLRIQREAEGRAFEVHQQAQAEKERMKHVAEGHAFEVQQKAAAEKQRLILGELFAPNTAPRSNHENLL
jgi:hypothetical protein